jgi:hypothetical protein
MKSKKIFLAGICLSVMSIAMLPAVTSAAYDTQDYTHKDTNVNSDIAYQMKPSEIVELYPMSAEKEAAIVHVIPECPVTIDGVLYKAEDISLFDGKRLHFTTDKPGNLYAFTSVLEMEAFLGKEYGNVFELPADKNSREVSYLYSDWLFNGIRLECAPGQQHEDLAVYDLDNCISSAKVSNAASVVLWDYANFGGDSFTMPPGSNYAVLALQGWNDRASSIS